MLTKIQTLTSADGLHLHQVSWAPTVQPKANIILVHGLGEHCSRYDPLAGALNHAAIAALAIDLRGHGRSGGPRGHTPGMAAYVDDLALLADFVQSDLPLFMYGHSLGGLIAIHFALSHQNRLKGLIVSAPAIKRRFEVPPYKRILGRIMSGIWPGFTQATGLNPDDLSRVEEVVRAYREDPLVHDKASARLFTAASDGGPEALERAAELQLPVAVIQGGQDRLINAEASLQFFERLGAGDKTWIHIPDGYHETHNEADGNKVIHQIVEWVSDRL